MEWGGKDKTCPMPLQRLLARPVACWTSSLEVVPCGRTLSHGWCWIKATRTCASEDRNVPANAQRATVTAGSNWGLGWLGALMARRLFFAMPRMVRPLLGK